MHEIPWRLPARSATVPHSLQLTWVINPAVGCHYFRPGPQLPSQRLRGLLPVSQLSEQRHDGCEQFALDSVAAAIWTQAQSPTAPESSTLTTRLPALRRHTKSKYLQRPSVRILNRIESSDTQSTVGPPTACRRHMAGVYSTHSVWRRLITISRCSGAREITNQYQRSPATRYRPTVRTSVTAYITAETRAFRSIRPRQNLRNVFLRYRLVHCVVCTMIPLPTVWYDCIVLTCIRSIDG